MGGSGRSLGLVVAVALAVTGCTDPTPTAAPAEGPPPPPVRSDGIGTPSPDPTMVAVAMALDDVGRGASPLTSMAVVRDGAALGDAYADGLAPDARQPVWSVTKSVVAVLVGIAIEEGRLALDTRLAELFPDAGTHGDVTVEHLLTMTSGLDLPETEASFRAAYAAEDWVAFLLSQGATSAPGERFRYCSLCVHLLTAALHEVTGDLAGWADARLFSPLGIEEVVWERAADGSGTPIGGWGLALTAPELARLGRLHLDRGAWEGRQLVPADWVDTSVAAHVAVGEPFEAWQVGYGYLWWVRDGGGYAATGRGGQLIVVVPDHGLVVGTTADLPDDEALDAFTFVWTRVVLPLAIGASDGTGP